MENRSNPSDPTSVKHVNFFIDPAILLDFSGLSDSLSHFKLVSIEDAQISILKKGDRLWANFSDGEHCDYPYYRKNVLSLLEGFLLAGETPNLHHESFESLIKTAQSIEKRVFSSVSLSPGENVKDLWDEVIKKINSISAGSHSLNGLVERVLEVPFLQSFQTSLVVLHLKGQTKASIIGTMWRGERIESLVEVKDFNIFFNSIKKSKIKSFSTDAFTKLNLPFNGSFLAKEVISMKYSLVAIVSRHDFLSFGKEEIELFETCIDLLQPHFER